MTRTDVTEAHAEAGPSPISEIDVHWTAEEAFPAFERACLAARTRISGSFRVFDTGTHLHSEEGRAIGETWFDLLLHLLDRGIEIHLVVTDFDPIVATVDHRRSWSSARQFEALNELSQGATLTYAIAMHPARVGAVPRRMLHSKIMEKLEDREADPLSPGLHDLEPGDDLPLVPSTHHQKLAVIDDTVLYIGGLDLNNRRYDTLTHDQPSAQTWHDIQAVVRGPVVAAAAAHLATFEAVTEGVADAPPAAPGFLRTLSRKRDQDLLHIAPRSVVAEIEDAHLRAIGRAQGLLYFETQFFRHLSLARALAAAAAADPGLACIVILPATPEDVAFLGNEGEDSQLGARAQEDVMDVLADGFGDRIAVAAPAQRTTARDTPEMAQIHGAPLIYVHAKLSIFGRDEAIIGSANLNGRSLRLDTEAALHLTERTQIDPLWSRVLTHWMGAAAPDPFGDACALVAELNADLRRNAELPPDERRHALLPFDRAEQADRAAGLPFVPRELV